MKHFDTSAHDRVKKFLQSAIHKSKGAHGPYVISFTDDEAARMPDGQNPGDRLSQWRSYCAGGNGISVGFDHSKLDKSGKGEAWAINGATAYLVNCIYGRDDKIRVLEGVGEMVGEEFDSVIRKITELTAQRALMIGRASDHKSTGLELDRLKEKVRELRSKLITGIVFNATSLKNQAFYEEREWRIVVHGLPRSTTPGMRQDGCGSKLEFRSSARGITPYIEIPLSLRGPDSPLMRVVVGPTPHMENALDAAQMLLEEHGIKVKKGASDMGVEVVPSIVPFRNW